MMWLLKSQLNQNLIAINHKFNSYFKSHIIFFYEQNSDLYHYLLYNDIGKNVSHIYAITPKGTSQFETSLEIPYKAKFHTVTRQCET
jgi:phosphoketolase